MRYQHLSRLFLLLLLAAALLIVGCSALAKENSPAPDQPEAQPTRRPQPAHPPTTAPAPTPIETLEKGGSEAPNIIFDPDEFKAALLQALMEQDSDKLQRWMTFPFLTGGWGADASDTAPADALQELYTYYLGTDNRLELVKDADLKVLMGELDPLSLPRVEAGVIEAVLVSGWGKDGRDEAILFIARAADNSLKWHGWIVVKGGFSGARLGGIQPYKNEVYGYYVYLPKAYEILESSASNVMIMAPGVGHPGEQRAAAIIEVGPANGRTVEEIVEQVKADVGPGLTFPPALRWVLIKPWLSSSAGCPGKTLTASCL